MTAAALADETGVSLRTIYRDVDALSAAGVPIVSEAGPAGGYSLIAGYRTRLTGLTPGEAGALFLAGMPGPAAELGLGALLASAELKLLAALPPGLRESAALARERFHLDAPGWFRDDDRPPHLGEIAAAVWDGQSLRVAYRGREGVSTREVAPLGLVLKAGVWYLVALAGDEPRTYRVSRIDEVAPTGLPVVRPPGFDLAAYWAASSERFLATMYGGRAVVRVSPRGMRELGHILGDLWVTRVTLESAGPPDAAGWVKVAIPVEEEEIALVQLLRFGPEAEVLAPEGLRRRMAEAVAGMAANYEKRCPG